jgi:hypothetical protein
MFPLILCPPLQRFDLLCFDLRCLLDVLGDVSVSPDASDLGHVFVALFEGGVVFKVLALASGFYAAVAGGGMGTPEADVAVVGAS